MVIKVLGTGCANCRKLEQLAREVVAEMGWDARVEKEEDLGRIMGYGVLSTPALVVDDRVVASGRVPSKAQLTTILVDARSASSGARDDRGAP